MTSEAKKSLQFSRQKPTLKNETFEEIVAHWAADAMQKSKTTLFLPKKRNENQVENVTSACVISNDYTC